MTLTSPEGRGYCVGDVIQAGGVGGQVERMTLRMTIVRNLQGMVHFGGCFDWGLALC